MTDAMTDEDHLLRLEQKLLDPLFRKQAQEVAALLTDEFREFGSSGQIFTKAEIVAILLKEAGVQLSLTDFRAVAVAPGVMLATYRAERNTAQGEAVRSLRSSVWVHEEGTWKMAFHQGTRC